MKKQVSAIFAFSGIILLASCGGGTTTSSSSASAESKDSSSSAESSSVASSSSEESLENYIFNKDLPRGATTFIDEEGVEQQLNFDRLYRNAGSPHVNSHPEGVQSKLLVAPIRFLKDENDPLDTIEANDDLYEHIRISFSGTHEEVRKVAGDMYSLEEFYNTSSYGLGGFEVNMLPTWVDYEGTAKDFASASNGSAGVYAANYVRDWYIKEYAKENHGLLGVDAEPISYFDADQDGYIDLVWNVYAYPYTQSTDWWAYVTYTSAAPNLKQPNVKTLAWASTNFMNSGFNGYDSHTFIHETGHTLGVNDFYDYNNTWKPMGSIDYMDQNLGDHNSYTKFAYGWTNPYVIEPVDLEGGKTARVTLRAASPSGDCLVLASPGYNFTAFDEYLMIELVGPYGIAKEDYKNGYTNTTGFTEGGIRVLHIDARAYSNDHNTYYTDADELGRKATDLRVCNTYGGRIGYRSDSDYWPYEDPITGKLTKNPYQEAALIEATVLDSNWTNSANYNATNASLFHKGQRLNMTAESPWTTTFFPSKTNLWNKAKTITGWQKSEQVYDIDETCTCDYRMKVINIVDDPTYGAVATVDISLIA